VRPRPACWPTARRSSVEGEALEAQWQHRNRGFVLIGDGIPAFVIKIDGHTSSGELAKPLGGLGIGRAAQPQVQFVMALNWVQPETKAVAFDECSQARNRPLPIGRHGRSMSPAIVI